MFKNSVKKVRRQTHLPFYSSNSDLYLTHDLSPNKRVQPWSYWVDTALMPYTTFLGHHFFILNIAVLHAYYLWNRNKGMIISHEPPWYFIWLTLSIILTQHTTHVSR